MIEDRPSRQTWITGDIFVRPGPLAPPTLHAWEPWYVTLDVLFELQNSDIDKEHNEWRTQWIAGVAMLRATGHVLDKVDARASTKHRTVVDAVWSDWRSNKDANWIFFDFIEKERNNILKTFSFGAELPAKEDGRILAYGNTDLDATQLFREAVYWWRSQLREIESRLA